MRVSGFQGLRGLVLDVFLGSGCRVTTLSQGPRFRVTTVATLSVYAPKQPSGLPSPSSSRCPAFNGLEGALWPTVPAASPSSSCFLGLLGFRAECFRAFGV